MAVPTIEYAYLSPDRGSIQIVCRIDSTLAPLVGGSTGWTIIVDGVTVTVFDVFVADPRPNLVTITPDDTPSISSVVTVAYSGGTIADSGAQALATSAAITVENRLPVIDLIARDIASRLADITTAGGYVVNLSVIDNLKGVQAIAEGNAWVTYDDPVSEDDAPINHEQFTVTFHIGIATAVSTATDTPLTSREYQIEAEVMKLLQVDYSRNNLAVDTVPLAPTRVDFGIGGWGGISVNVMVRFRTLYGDRFSQ
jgi:hypothetical protein